MTYDEFTVPVDVPQVSQWMELLRPDAGTQTLLRYDHPAYSMYAAATYHPYQKGGAAYIGAMLEPAALDALLEALLPRMGLALRLERWPLVIKEGENDAGRRLRYVLNYSAKQTAAAAPFACTELLGGQRYTAGQAVPLAGWGVAILEEDAGR